MAVFRKVLSLIITLGKGWKNRKVIIIAILLFFIGFFVIDYFKSEEKATKKEQSKMNKFSKALPLIITIVGLVVWQLSSDVWLVLTSIIVVQLYLGFTIGDSSSLCKKEEIDLMIVFPIFCEVLYCLASFVMGNLNDLESREIIGAIILLAIPLIIGYKIGRKNEKERRAKEIAEKNRKAKEEFEENYLKTHTQEQLREYYANLERKRREMEAEQERKAAERAMAWMNTPATGDYFRGSSMDDPQDCYCVQSFDVCQYCVHKRERIEGEHQCRRYNNRVERS